MEPPPPAPPPQNHIHTETPHTKNIEQEVFRLYWYTSTFPKHIHATYFSAKGDRLYILVLLHLNFQTLCMDQFKASRPLGIPRAIYWLPCLGSKYSTLTGWAFGECLRFQDDTLRWHPAWHESRSVERLRNLFVNFCSSDPIIILHLQHWRIFSLQNSFFIFVLTK